MKIACGPNDSNYEWTEVLMKNAGKYADAITLHYYTIMDTWQHKGSATSFTQEEYYTTLRKALVMEALVSNHLQIMNRHDPEHRVGLIVDEWGTWHDVEPGTNPGFLFQQNTMRDALVAALTLNIFNSHCDRVVMANLAQTVNVLQSVILTEGDKMVLTPTYHVFDLYKAHQDALGLDIHLDGVSKSADGVPQLSASASVKDGVLTLTIANTSAAQAAQTQVELAGMEVSAVSGRILTGAMDALNDFGAQNHVCVKPFDGANVGGGKLTINLPACSVAEITCR